MFALAASASLTFSCDDSEDFSAGPKVADDCVGVYFPVQDSYSYVFGSTDEEKSLSVKISRLSSDKAIAIPIQVNADAAGVSAPGSITFDEGQKEATFTITCDNIPLKQNVKCSVSVPEEYYNPYALGSGSISLDLLVSDWTLWAERAEFVFENYYSPVYSDIYAMPGTKNFKIVNFLGSGIDVPFKAIDFTPGKGLPSKSRLFPTENLWDEEDSYNTWYLYDWSDWTYPEWTPDPEVETTITYLNVYGWDESTGDWWCYIDFENHKGETTSYISYSDDSSSWDYITFSYGETLFEIQ